MLWFDQAMWFLVNNLERFFDIAYGDSFTAKFGAFFTWLNGADMIDVSVFASRVIPFQLRAWSLVE
jgi:hypothetical protein